MWIICLIADVMPESIFIAIENVVGTACDINGIDKAVFAEGIGEVPEGFFVAGGDVVELIVDTTDGATLHLAMQEETAWDSAVADKDELAEERATTLLNEVLDLLAP